MQIGSYDYLKHIYIYYSQRRILHPKHEASTPSPGILSTIWLQ